MKNDIEDMNIDEEDTSERKSKGQLKREAESAQALGKAMVDLPDSDFKRSLKQLELPEDLLDALIACRKIKSHEAHRRQLQFIGKLMRGIDCEPIEQALESIKRSGQIATAKLHEIERWRERLLEQGDNALTELKELYPHIDTTQVRQLVANARRELAKQQAPRAARKLFKYLRDYLTG